MKRTAKPIFLLFLLAVMVIINPQVTDSASPKGETFTNSIGMKFVLIPAGTFMMGSPPNEPERDNDERQHKVTISTPFYLQTTEVTQGQWKRVMGDNPSYFRGCGEDCPVEMVSWSAAQQFIKRLNDKERTARHRLPTEAEWEYACRAGTSTPFYTGNCITTDQANYNGNYPTPQCPKGVFAKRTSRVGSFPHNPWGLYDMHGNVSEWCQDWYDHYVSNEVTDPKGPPDAPPDKSYVLRGGSWNDRARFIRSANRGGLRSMFSTGRSGFRVVRYL